jgi:predicted lipoprotein with Yx(FWY)xxD motif
MRIIMAAALLVSAAACSGAASTGDSGSHAGGPTAGVSEAPTPRVSAPARATPVNRPPGAARFALIAQPSPYGNIVETGSGFVVYAFSADGPRRSACAGTCAKDWSPLLVTVGARFGDGIVAALVGQVDRSDGGHQMTYGGHPLYIYHGDSQPGQIGGQAARAYGGTWQVVSASGQVAGGAIYSPPPAQPGGA